jgi:hypothetical protein
MREVTVVLSVNRVGFGKTIDSQYTSSIIPRIIPSDGTCMNRGTI